MRASLLLLALVVLARSAAAQPALPELYYEVDGAGSPIVFVPEWAGDASTWFRTLPFLRDGHQLIRYDPRGQGRSEAPANGDYSVEAHRDDLLRVMDALDVERTDVVAAGLGCRIAIAAAIERPERFSSLTLIEPHLAWTNEEASFWGRFLQGWDQSGRPSMGEYAAVLVGHWFDDLFMRRETWLVDFYDLLLRRQDPEELVASLRSWLADDFAMPEGRNPVPVLIVRGSHHGNVEPLGDPRIRAAFPYTRRVYIRGSGGSPQIETPRELDEVIRARWAALAEPDSL
ncbi:MAG TPA: alpha/beta hydrolase [Gemmatimonadota bacterium]|nr:alpha/beta hydrolase [Gemmatimonadota bacterium]